MKKILDKLKKKFDRKIFSLLLKKIDSLSLTDLDEKRRNHIFNYHKNDYKFEKDQVVFIHVPKTGGASIRECLEKNLSNFYIFNKKSEHNTISLLCSPNDYKYITFLRNPIDRVYSYFNMLKKHKAAPGHSLANKSIGEFLINSFHAKNLYCQYFSGMPYEIVNQEIYEIALSNLKKFLFVGNFEDFNNSFKELCLKLNLETNTTPHINQNNYEKINEDQIKLIANYNRFDIKLYNEFFNKDI